MSHLSHSLARSAGFPACCTADFPVGRSHECSERPQVRKPAIRQAGKPALRARARPSSKGSEISGSVLVVVLWVALGLVTITLYFASSMSLELKAADNRVSGLASDQAIEGGIRYVQYLLSNLAT